MEVISELTVDLAAQRLGKFAEDESLPEYIEALKERQPHWLAYFTSETTDPLTAEEQEYLLFVSLNILTAIEMQVSNVPLIEEETIGRSEEKNWALLNQQQSKIFHERITPFFEEYPQEDLLAFVEDALIPDEESPVTKTGRELMFIMLKSGIDGWVSSYRSQQVS